MKETIRSEVIEPVVELLGGGGAAVELIYYTGLAESGYRVTEQHGGGPALGYWQMEPATHDDIWDNFLRYRQSLRNDVQALARASRSVADDLRDNHMYACAMCRVHYMRVSDPLPDAGDLEAMASYWKEFYNTFQGKGTINHFLEAARDS